MKQAIFQASLADKKEKTAYNVTLSAPEGLGFGEGAISFESRAGVTVNIADIERAVTSHAVLTPIDRDDHGNLLDDDGCGDGRGVVRVQEGKLIHKRSLNRAKVFGGGATMTVAALIGLDKAGQTKLNDLFRTALEHLQRLRIGYGAHTDHHHTDPKACGCGAIDKAPKVIQNVVAYENEIRATIGILGVAANELYEVFTAYRSYAAVAARDETYEGREVANDIIDSGVVVKDLGDDHKEMYIVLNYVPGCTINQEYVRAMSDGQAQVFGVDVWRMQDLARRSFPVEAHKAFLSELVYTLGVAATLTKGDLPVYTVQPQAV